jgi:hypothetical protein
MNYLFWKCSIVISPFMHLLGLKIVSWKNLTKFVDVGEHRRVQMLEECIWIHTKLLREFHTRGNQIIKNILGVMLLMTLNLSFMQKSPAIILNLGFCTFFLWSEPICQIAISTSEIVFLIIFLSLKPQHGDHANNFMYFIHSWHSCSNANTCTISWKKWVCDFESMVTSIMLCRFL